MEAFIDAQMWGFNETGGTQSKRKKERKKEYFYGLHSGCGITVTRLIQQQPCCV